jgi:hypothetical protein
MAENYASHSIVAVESLLAVDFLRNLEEFAALRRKKT